MPTRLFGLPIKYSNRVCFYFKIKYVQTAIDIVVKR